MKPLDCVLTALELKKPERIPTMEWFIDGYIGQVLCGTDDPVKIAQRLDLDGVSIQADYAKTPLSTDIYIDEWGVLKNLTGNAVATSYSYPFQEPFTFNEFHFPNPHAIHRLESLERAVKSYGDTRAVVFNIPDGFSSICNLLGYQEHQITSLLKNDCWLEFLKRITDYHITLTEIAVKRLGIKIVALSDEIHLGKDTLNFYKIYEKSIYPLFCEMIRSFKSQGLKIIKHGNGDILPLIDMWIEAGIDGLDLGNATSKRDMADYKQKYGAKICLKGDISCTDYLCMGTEEQVREAVRECIRKAEGKNGGLIISSNRGIHHGVKPANYHAMLEAIREFG